MGFCEAQLDKKLLEPYLGRLIPMLMKNMVSAPLGCASSRLSRCT